MAFKKLASVLAVLVGSAVIGCATADMGYVKYSSPDDWSEKTKTGYTLPLAKVAGEWSEVKTFNTTAGPVGVQSKFIRQKGTTCDFEVQFTNNGTNPIDENVSLTSNQKDKVYSHRFTRVKVPAGKSLYWEMEKRECPVNWGETKEMNKCAECAPMLVFLKN